MWIYISFQVSGISSEIFKQIETVENDHDASTAAALEVSKIHLYFLFFRKTSLHKKVKIVTKVVCHEIFTNFFSKENILLFMKRSEPKLSRNTGLYTTIIYSSTFSNTLTN